MKKYIPNFLTSLNLLFGCIGSVMAFECNYIGVFYCVIISSIFDFMDGFAARILKEYSPIGKDLDSLADLISFGFMPGVLVYVFLLYNILPHLNLEIASLFIPYLGFILTIFSALRLAKFNNDKRQVDSFIGLPTPACALFWVSLIYTLSHASFFVQAYINTLFVFLILLILFFSYLLISEISMFSLKLNNFDIVKNMHVYILIVIMSICIYLYFISGVFVGVLFLHMVINISRNVNQHRLPVEYHNHAT